MVNPPVLEATFASGILLIATGFYGTQFLINHSGSDIAKLAIELNSQCLSLNVSSDTYTNCTYTLEKLVRNLTESGEIQVENCELDEADNSIAYCPVWVWYFPQWLPLTDVTIVGVVGGSTDREPIRPSPKLERILSKLSEASLELTDLSDQGNYKHFSKLEHTISSQSKISDQLSDLSDRDKDELSSDELEQIFSTMLIASQDLHDQLNKGKATTSDNNDNPLSVLDSHQLTDTSTGIIPEEIRKKASTILTTALQQSENEKDNLVEKNKSLKTFTKNLNLDSFASPELLEPFLQNANPLDVENLIQQKIMETLTQNINTEDLEDSFTKLMLVKSLVPSLPVETSSDKLGLLNAYVKYLESEDVEGILAKSGLIEAIVQNLATVYLDEAYETSGIEQALAENLKTNYFFENTLKSVIIDALVKNLHRSDDQGSIENFGLLLLLASNLEVNGFGGPLEQSGFMKMFLQNLKPEDVQAFLGKSDLTAISHYLETNLLNQFHKKSDLEEALVENIKSNHYIESSQKTDLMKKLEHSSGKEDTKYSVGNAGFSNSLSQDLELKDIQSPLNSLEFLKFLAPSLDANVLNNPYNKFNLMKGVLQNMNIGDVDSFLAKSGLVGSLTQHLDINAAEPQDKGYNEQSKGQDMELSHVIENALISHILKGAFSNSGVKSNRDFSENSGLIQALTTNIASNYLKDSHKPGNLGLVETLAENINTNNLGDSLKTGLLKTLVNQQETNDNYKSTGKLDFERTSEDKLKKPDEDPFNISDLINMFAKNENLFQNYESKLNHQTKEGKVTDQEYNDIDSSFIAGSHLNN